ncbi:MAG: BrnT family toxin [Selenomonadaceae bacterium]|nr:BrnT family toxin [Selenomonadaceae bacterium]
MGEIEIGDLIVEWDDNKAELNWKKHKIYFEDAAYVFLDEKRFEDYDELHSEYEDRWKVVGKVRDVLVVIYTERGEKYRLISARYANKKEEDEYYGQYPNL